MASLTMVIASACLPADPSVTLDPPVTATAVALRRASLDVRGRPPSVEELAQIEADPAAYDTLIKSFVDDPAFGPAVRDLFARAFRTRFEQYFNPDTRVDGQDPGYQNAVAEEPLMLLQAIALEDRPFTDLVTADTTFVDENTAFVWPVKRTGSGGYDEQRGGFQEVRYDDGRPSAGVLSMNAMYFRYLSCGSNFHRGRANAFSRILLCDNYLKRPVDFPRDIDLTDEEGIKTAVQTNVACTSCHASLDPMAAFLFGFVNDEGGDPLGLFDSERAEDWREATNARPAYHGQAGADLSDLGGHIASDPRFVRCATTRVFEGLLGRPATPEDFDAVSGHVEAFRAGGLTLKALYLSVLRDPGYLALKDDKAKLVSPEVLGSALAALTGYQATSDGVDLMRNDLEGLHVLGGGLDSRSGDYPATSPSTSRVLVQERAAEAAAAFLIDGLVEGETNTSVLGRVLAGVDMSAPPDEATLEVIVLSASSTPDPAFVAALALLWEDVVNDDIESVEAWIAVVSAVLRDSTFVIY